MSVIKQKSRRGGSRPGAGRKTNLIKGLRPPGVTLSARISNTSVEWAREQAPARFQSISSYIEFLIELDRIKYQERVAENCPPTDTKDGAALLQAQNDNASIDMRIRLMQERMLGN